MKKIITFGERAKSFFSDLQVPNNLPASISPIFPIRSGAHVYFDAFADAYLNDENERVFVLGINPGRFGSGVTGIPFTDPVQLELSLGIRNELKKRQELSSSFIYLLIKRAGGPKKFYERFYLGAVCPVGFLRNGKNLNYYDDAELLKRISPYIRDSLRAQKKLGAKRTLVILGKGKHAKIFSQLNKEFEFFDKIVFLEHPRYVMQYKRKKLEEYIEKYLRTLNDAFTK